MSEVIRDTYRDFSYVAEESFIDAGDGNRVLNGYEVYLKEETNPKIVFPDDLDGGAEWEKIKGNTDALRREIEKCLDAELNNIKKAE